MKNGMQSKGICTLFILTIFGILLSNCTPSTTQGISISEEEYYEYLQLKSEESQPIGEPKINSDIAALKQQVNDLTKENQLLLAENTKLKQSSTTAPTTASNPTPSQTNSSTSDPIIITANQLIKAYEQNKYNAETTYKNKLLQLTGTISSIGSGSEPYIILSVISDSLNGVHLYFSPEEHTKLLTLTQGQTITVRGTWTNNPLFNLFLTDSILVEALTTPSPPSPPVASVGSTRSNSLPVGQSMVTEGAEITIVDFYDGQQSWDIAYQANRFNDLPENGMQYVIITIKIKNIASEDEPKNYMSSHFELVGSSNTVFKTFDKSLVLPDQGALSDLRGELYHGGETVGSVHFYIPQNETDLVLISQIGYSDDSKRFFRVE